MSVFFSHKKKLKRFYRFLFYQSRAQVEVFIKGLFSFDQDLAAFKEHVRDFLGNFQFENGHLKKQYSSRLSFFHLQIFSSNSRIPWPRQF